jgi:hypothetical protein
MIRSVTLAAAALAASLAPAHAEQCRVSDPTGTPLNVRETPGGRIVGTLRNGSFVNMRDTVDDRRDAYVVREYITCKP